MTITLIVLVLTIALFIWGRVRSDIVALSALVVLILSGILTPAEALSGFSSSVVIMMVGLFVVGGAILQRGLARAAGNRMMGMAKGNETKAFLMAVTLGASMCFASPFSTPPNALVMKAGHYTFMDYVRVGLPLQIIIGVAMTFLLPLLWPF